MRWLLLLAPLGAGCHGQETSANHAPGVFGFPAAPVLLYVTHAAGFEHSSLGHSAAVLAVLGESAGFEVRHESDATIAITREALDGAAAIGFFTSGELPLSDEQRDLLLAFVSSGGGFVGFHSAADTFYEWPAYNELQGGWFNGHPWGDVEAEVMVTGPMHPASSALPASFRITDEFYQFKSFRSDRFVPILRLDTASVDTNQAGVVVQPWGFPLAWVGTHGHGRVFYSALGHGAVWDDPLFRAHIAGGVAWATRSE